MVLTGRFIPVARVAVNMTAGATSFPLSRFVPLAGLSAVLWATSSAAMGIGAGQLLRDSPLLAVCAGILLGIVVGLVIDWIVQWRRRALRRGHLK